MTLDFLKNGMKSMGATALMNADIMPKQANQEKNTNPLYQAEGGGVN